MYGASTAVEVVVAIMVAVVGSSYTCGNGTPFCWKNACECNLLVIQI
jgi:hypothetical protein